MKDEKAGMETRLEAELPFRRQSDCGEHLTVSNVLSGLRLQSPHNQY
jgi:hypothetical protein